MRYLASAYRLFKGLFRYVARRFLDLTIAVYIKVKENTLKVIAGAITAMLVAGTTLAWEPIKLKLIDPGLEWVTERLWPVEILDQRTAIQLARTLVGSSALEVIPFRNDRDPNHYVLVWTKGRDCGTENGQSCPHGTGAVYAELLAGSQGQYQRYSTNVPAIVGHNSPEAIHNPDTRALYTGVVDWNGDGVMEILAIADQDAFTSAQHTYFVHLYDTGNHSLSLMSITRDRNGIVKTQFGGTSPQLRAWFIDRFREFIDVSYLGVMCSRNRAGALSCARKLKEELPEADLDYWELRAAGVGDWLVSNGGDFTLGKIAVDFRPIPNGIDVLENSCALWHENIAFLNYFKGPLSIFDRDARKIGVLYVQDGSHHREIPSVVLGADFLWLGLAVDNDLIAINLETLEAIAVSVRQWSNGIPGEWNQGLTLSEEAAEKGEATKELQVGIYLHEGTLQYQGEALDLSSFLGDPRAEFANARMCPEW